MYVVVTTTYVRSGVVLTTQDVLFQDVNFPQHGDAEGVNPGNAPSVSVNFQNFSGAQTTPSAPTRHIPVVNHQRSVPNSPISPPLDPRDGILNYLVHQGILNSDLSLGIDHHTLSTIVSSARNNSRDVPITSMPQNTANPLIRDPRTSPDPNIRVSPPNSSVANDIPTSHPLQGNLPSFARSQIAQTRDRYLRSPISTAGVDIFLDTTNLYRPNENIVNSPQRLIVHPEQFSRSSHYLNAADFGQSLDSRPQNVAR